MLGQEDEGGRFRSSHRAGLAVDADDVGGIAGVRAAGLVAVTRDIARAGVASDGDVPLTTIAIHADFVTVAEIAAVAAVAGIRLRIDARIAVVAALLPTHAAILDAHAVLATRRISRTNVTHRTAVCGARLEVHALAVDERQTGATSAGAIFAIVGRALALDVAAAATIRIVLGVFAVVAAAIRQAVHARTTAGITQAPRIVAIVAAVAAVVDVDLEIRAAIEARLLSHWAIALPRRTRSAIALLTALTAVVGIRRDVRTGIAARHFAHRTGALPIRARCAERTEEAASAAVCLVRAELDTTNVRTAIHGSRRTHALSRRTYPVRTALVAALTAVVDVHREICAGILRIAGNLAHRTGRAHTGYAHLPIEAIIAALAAVVQIRRKVRTTTGTCDLALRTGTSARNTRCALEAIVAAHAAIVVVGAHVDASAAAFQGSRRTSALSRHALAAHGTRIAACSAVFGIARKIRANTLVITRYGARGAFAKPIDARGAGRTLVAARTAILWIGRQMRAQTAAIVGLGRFTRRALPSRTRRAYGTGIAALTAIGGIPGKVKTPGPAIHGIRTACALAIRARASRATRNAACAAVRGIGRRIDAFVHAQDVGLIGTSDHTTARSRA